MLVDKAVKQLEERAGDRLLDEQARAGETDLSRVVVLARCLPRRRLEIAVREHEERPLAAELSGERDEVARGSDADRAGGLRRSRERDPAHIRVRDERGTDLLPDPLHDVEDAGRQPRLRDEVAEQRARQRRPFGGLEHHRASRRRAPVRVFHVESMNGAFHGVITTAGPLGMRMTRLAVPFDDHTRSS